jgi:hypothetical protein
VAVFLGVLAQSQTHAGMPLRQNPEILAPYRYIISINAPAGSRVLLTVSHDPDECDGGKTAQAFDSMVQVLHDLPMVAAMENFHNKEQRIKIGISDAF